MPSERLSIYLLSHERWINIESRLIEEINQQFQNNKMYSFRAKS
jgi:hypothetical protein